MPTKRYSRTTGGRPCRSTTKFLPFQASSQNSLSCPLEYRFIFKNRRASSLATNARPWGLASNRTASRSIVLSDRHSLGATNGPGSVASAGFGGAGNLASIVSARAFSHFFFSTLAFSGAGFVLSLHLRDLLFASPFDQ